MSRAFVSRPLGAHDVDLASALHGEAFAALGERSWSAREIADLLASPGVVGLMLEDDGRKIGFALCRTVVDEAELLTIVVGVDHRRLGAGGELLGKVVDLARKRGVRRLFLEVGADNPAALALYGRIGFRPVGRRAAYYSRGNRPAVDAVVMSLSLD